MAFTCPRCGATSHHPADQQFGYCARCHDFTASPPGNVPNAGATHILVDGIVAAGNKEPYVRLTVNGEKAQLDIAEAKKIALDLLAVAARTEADAMILRFFSDNKFPEGAAAALMQEFRYFRQQQDEKPIDAFDVDPDTGEAIR